MESRLLRIGWIVMLILGVYWFLGSIYWLVALVPGMTEFEQTAGQSWESFVAANTPAVADWAKMALVLHGITLIAYAVLVIPITLYAYRRGQKWSWYTLLASGLIYHLGMLIHHIITGANLSIPIIGLVLLVIALAVPAKDILTQKSS